MSSNQWGESPSYYIWPEGHVEGDPYPDDFDTRLYKVLQENGFGVENT